MLAFDVRPANYDVLRTLSFTAELSDEQCAVLATLTEKRRFADKEFLLIEGESDDSLFVVVRGKLAVVKGSGEREEIIEYIREGEIAGAMGFVDGEAHSASLRTAGEVEVLCLHGSQMRSLLGDYPELVYYVMRAIVRSVHNIVRNMNDQCIQLTNYIVKQRGRY